MYELPPVKGDIIVRTGKSHWQNSARLGKIIRVKSVSGDILYYDDYVRIEVQHCRHASKQEKLAFINDGIKHISNVKSVVDDYSII